MVKGKESVQMIKNIIYYVSGLAAYSDIVNVGTLYLFSLIAISN